MSYGVGASLECHIGDRNYCDISFINVTVVPVPSVTFPCDA